MKIVHDDGRTLRLYGVVMELPWVLVLIVLCGTGWAVMPALFVGAIKSGRWYMAIGPCFGVGVIALLTFVGSALVLQREAMEIDRIAGTGFYRKWFRIFGREERKEFKVEHVHSVSVEFAKESPGGRRGFPVSVCRARLRLEKPRRAFEIDETRNHSDERIRALAERVAAFINVPVEQVGSPDDDVEPRRKRRRRR